MQSKWTLNLYNCKITADYQLNGTANPSSPTRQGQKPEKQRVVFYLQYRIYLNFTISKGECSQDQIY
jgi:hypothetical protein